MRNNDTRRGVAVAEFALIMSLIFFPLLAGVWDFSQLIEVNDILTRSAREGVVLASRGSDVVEPVRATVQAAGLSDTNLTVSVAEGADVPDIGREITVALSYDVSGMTFFSWGWLLGDTLSVQASAKME